MKQREPSTTPREPKPSPRLLLEPIAIPKKTLRSTLRPNRNPNPIPDQVSELKKENQWCKCFACFK